MKTMTRVGAWMFACMQVLPGALAAPAAAEATQKPLQLLLSTPLDVDGNATTATTTLELYNPNAATVNYVLTVQKATVKNTNLPAKWAVTFYGPDNRPVGPELDGSVEPNKKVAVKLDVANAVEAGVTTAELDNDNVKIADLELTKDRDLPFRVSVEGNPANKPELDFVQGEPLTLRLKNEDGMHYPVKWELTINGTPVSGTAMLVPDGSAEIKVTPVDEWFSTYRSLFKSQTVDGTLTLGYMPPGTAEASPTKSFPITAKLDAHGTAARDFWGSILIVVILLLGVLASTYVNVDLANRLKAVFIYKRLGQLARVIGQIGPTLSSQMEVSLWQERGRLEATLPKKWRFTPAVSGELKQSDTDTDTLSKRVDMAVEISNAAVRLENAVDEGALAPTLTEEVRKNLSRAQDLLQKSVLSTEEWQKTQTLVGAAINMLDAAGTDDADLEKEIGARLNVLSGQFDELGKVPLCGEIKAGLSILFDVLVTGKAASATQAERDAITRKLMVIADLVKMGKKDEEILKQLKRQDIPSLFMAEQLLRELKEEISLNELITVIKAEPVQLYIKPDRDQVRPNMPILMKLKFNKEIYNRASAKRRIVCEWDFGHEGLKATGWEVYHYFPAVQPYTVSVTMRDRDRIVITTRPITCLLNVKAPRVEWYNPTFVMVQQWAVGILIAVAGLFAGAKDKILSLETTSAIFAIFVLGFGIDTAKNLLMPKQ